MKILVIGSKGFIGSHTLAYLGQFHECWGADVVTDYTASNYFRVDSTNADFGEIFEQQRFDLCINCSGAASVPDSLLHPQRDYELNVHNTFKILDAIRRHQPACKFIHLSSAAVYGNPERLPVDEACALQPVSPYGEHKKMAETICRYFYQYFGVASVSLRLFSVYGPGLHKQLFWDLYQKCRSAETIDVYGTGAESRDFIYIKDLVRVFRMITETGTFDAGVYNVANGQEIRIGQAVDTFTRLMAWPGAVRYSQHQRPGDPLNWCADIRRIQLLGYTPAYSLEQGLEEYLAWVQEKR